MPELDPALYAVVWIALLPIEARAALHMMDNIHDGRFPMSRGDDYVFLAGDMLGHNIIIATLPAGQEYGTESAAALASQAKKFFPNLWFGLLVGVAAGLPNLLRQPPRDIRLGDILVALPEGGSAGLVAYDLGKETVNDGFQPLHLGHALASAEPFIRSAIGSIKLRTLKTSQPFLQYYEAMKDEEHEEGNFLDPGQDSDILYETAEDGTEKPVNRQPRIVSQRTRVWYGPIGSGEKLVKNARKGGELRDKHNIIGLELEAAGTMNEEKDSGHDGSNSGQENYYCSEENSREESYYGDKESESSEDSACGYDGKEVITRLCEFSFLSIRPNDPEGRVEAYNIHKLVQEAAQYRLQKGKDEARDEAYYVKTASQVTNHLFPHSRRELWEQCEQCVTHAQPAATWAELHRGEVEVVELLTRVSYYLKERGRRRGRDAVDTKALYFLQKTLGDQ